MEEFFVDNRNIKKQIMPAYGKVIDVMKTKLNHAEVYQEIDLFNRESRIMFEILKFNPDFKKKWEEDCKFVYSRKKNKSNVWYSDVFIKNPKNNDLTNFSKDKCEKNLTKLEKNFNNFIKTEKDLDFLRKEISYRKELGLCTRIFGKKTEFHINTNIDEFIFCDYCLARTDYNEYKCSNPLEQHVTSDKILRKPEYAQGIEATNIDEEDTNDYYKVKEEFYIKEGLKFEKNNMVYLKGNEFKYMGKLNSKIPLDKLYERLKDAPVYTLPDNINETNFDQYFENIEF